MYDIKEKQRTVYIAETRGAKDVISYEFYQSGDGWWINKEQYNVETPFPKKEEIYITNEVIEKILLVQTAKRELL